MLSWVFKYVGGLVFFYSTTVVVVLVTVLKQAITLLMLPRAMSMATKAVMVRRILDRARVCYSKSVRCWFYNLVRNGTLEIA